MGRILGLLIGLATLPTMAQQTVIVQPVGVGGTNDSGVIASSSAFQKVFDENSSRKGCVIQNKSSNSMYVTVGVGVADSTQDGSFVLAANSSFHCADGIVTLTGEVDIKGTQNDKFYASQY